MAAILSSDLPISPQGFCNPAGLDCWASPTNTSCPLPCQGVYADIEHLAHWDGQGLEERQEYRGMLEDYYRYKTHAVANYVYDENEYWSFSKLGSNQVG